MDEIEQAIEPGKIVSIYTIGGINVQGEITKEGFEWVKVDAKGTTVFVKISNICTIEVIDEATSEA